MQIKKVSIYCPMNLDSMRFTIENAYLCYTSLSISSRNQPFQFLCQTLWVFTHMECPSPLLLWFSESFPIPVIDCGNPTFCGFTFQRLLLSLDVLAFCHLQNGFCADALMHMQHNRINQKCTALRASDKFDHQSVSSCTIGTVDFNFCTTSA